MWNYHLLVNTISQNVLKGGRSFLRKGGAWEENGTNKNMIGTLNEKENSKTRINFLEDNLIRKIVWFILTLWILIFS